MHKSTCFVHFQALSHRLSDQVGLSVFQADLIGAFFYFYESADVIGDMSADTRCYLIVSMKSRRMLNFDNKTWKLIGFYAELHQILHTAVLVTPIQSGLEACPHECPLRTRLAEGEERDLHERGEDRANGGDKKKRR
ncbi:hypothetical protein AB205_0059950 [Aquarana catesbeiana]|uniref:Uncharacterized protein n=1 Tax=Aquarana catesbeiana TaxID=8400 RepID=A0A2G9PVN8_AQUCT|nr:hypothetical protein AB205_0059950 [Aquarana catesbeiana]